MDRIRDITLGLSLFAGVIGCQAPRVAPERFEYARLAMGMEARIVLHAPDRPSAESAAEAAFATLAALDRVLSDWNHASELSRVVRTAAEAPVPISADLCDVTRRALELARATDGAFDPTLGPVVGLWRAARRDGRLPSGPEIEAARARTGWRGVRLDVEARTLFLARPDMRLDFGAIGKGYACQRALAVLTARGIESALVELGGDLACSAPPPGRDGWAIELGPNPGASTGERLIVSHVAVSTSGDREQSIEIDGRRHSHVVDPSTGLGLTNRARVVVIAADGATADALSTALAVKGGAAALDLARATGVEALVEEVFDGERRVLSTPGFDRLRRISAHER